MLVYLGVLECQLYSASDYQFVVGIVFSFTFYLFTKDLFSKGHSTSPPNFVHRLLLVLNVDNKTLGFQKTFQLIPQIFNKSVAVENNSDPQLLPFYTFRT